MKDHRDTTGNRTAPATITVKAVLALICAGATLLCGQTFMYWNSNFGSINLASISSQSQVSEGSSSVTLFTNGDAEITADNSATAQLASATDTLVTEYKLTFDGDGSSATGSSDTSYTTYDLFLATPASITHVTSDDDVLVTLHVRASNGVSNVADSGAYSATQTLTVHWIGP